MVKNQISLNRGGVGSLIKKCLKYEARDGLIIWIEGKVESSSIEVELNGRKNLISMVY